MILQALTAYYEDLARTGKIARQGWGKSRISYALELGENGEVRPGHSSGNGGPRRASPSPGRWSCPHR